MSARSVTEPPAAGGVHTQRTVERAAPPLCVTMPAREQPDTEAAWEVPPEAARLPSGAMLLEKGVVTADWAKVPASQPLNVPVDRATSM